MGNLPRHPLQESLADESKIRTTRIYGRIRESDQGLRKARSGAVQPGRAPVGRLESTPRRRVVSR
jgi:hypothetical protein